MRARAVSLTIVAFLLGALAAGGIGVRVIREVKTADDATSLPPSNIASDDESGSGYFVDPSETLIVSTALVPRSVAADDGRVAIAYDLVSLAPQLGLLPPELDVVVADGEIDSIYPKTWVVETTGGPVEGGQANVRATTARFDVGPDFSADDIESVRVTEAYAPFPFAVEFSLSELEPVTDIGFGITVELLDVVDQGSATIVRVAVEPGDMELAGLVVVGAGPGWTSTGTSGESGRVVMLTWVGGPLPGEIPLRTEGGVWLPIAGEFDVSLVGAP